MIAQSSSRASQLVSRIRSWKRCSWGPRKFKFNWGVQVAVWVMNVTQWNQFELFGAHGYPGAGNNKHRYHGHPSPGRTIATVNEQLFDVRDSSVIISFHEFCSFTAQNPAPSRHEPWMLNVQSLWVHCIPGNSCSPLWQESAPADIEKRGPQPDEAHEDEGYVSQEEIRKGKPYVNGAFKDMEIVILNVTLWLLVLWMSSAKHTISEIYLEHVDRKDTQPLQENPPELTPEEKAKALDAASNMQIDATDQEADILKATPDIIFVCICKKVAMRLCIYIYTM